MKVRLRYDPVVDHLAQVNRDARPARKSRWWYWLIILGCGALLGWWLITAGQRQQNPGPPVKAKQMRAIT